MAASTVLLLITLTFFGRNRMCYVEYKVPDVGFLSLLNNKHCGCNH